MEHYERGNEFLPVLKGPAGLSSIMGGESPGPDFFREPGLLSALPYPKCGVPHDWIRGS